MNTTLIISAAVFGMIIGAVLILGLILLSERLQQKNDPSVKQKVRRLKSPRRHRNESEQRAALQARMMVASGAFSGPVRR